MTKPNGMDPERMFLAMTSIAARGEREHPAMEPYTTASRLLRYFAAEVRTSSEEDLAQFIAATRQR